jgi:hypothetical protein
MKLLFALLIFLISPFRSAPSFEDELPVPSRIKTCLESQPLKVYRVDSRVNPYGRQFILGAGSRPEFSHKKDDNFLSADWEVLTLAEFRDQVYDKKAAANAKGEVILLSWEDGSSYIYWDGTAYRLLSEVPGGPSN